MYVVTASSHPDSWVRLVDMSKPLRCETKRLLPAKTIRKRQPVPRPMGSRQTPRLLELTRTSAAARSAVQPPDRDEYSKASEPSSEGGLGLPADEESEAGASEEGVLEGWRVAEVAQWKVRRGVIWQGEGGTKL